MDKIYLDYAATTPVSESVMRKMKPYFSDIFGNTESIHSFGQKALGAIDNARKTIANALRVSQNEIIFTGSATEANNILIRGVLKSFEGTALDFTPKIITSTIEHNSVFNLALELEREGAMVVRINADKNGIVDPKDIKNALDERVILVSIMYGNNEIGSIQKIKEIGNIIREFRGDRNFPIFHTDAVQAFQFLECKPEELLVDALTLSGHKIYGPKGVGVLFLSKKILFPTHNGKIQPILFGGEHEFGLRPGTVNVPSVVGIAEAISESEKKRTSRLKKTGALKKYFLEELKKVYKNAKVNGTFKSDSLPHILNLFFPDISAEELIIALDLRGVAVSSGSACSSKNTISSRTVRSIYEDETRARKSIRFSFGEHTTKTELDITIEALDKILKRAQKDD